MDLKEGPRPLADGVYWVGVNDRVKELFESMWPLPHGVTYNAYVVVGREATALIDTVHEDYAYEYLGRVMDAVGDLSKVKYLVVNHLEPDHHGATPYVLSRLKHVKAVVSTTAARLLRTLYDIPEDRLIVVKDGDTLDLGGRTLRFISAPWLHWPETMFTYLQEDKILFTCDAFGSYGLLEKGLFDDEVELADYIKEARRYYANIVAKYGRNVLDALKKIEGLEVKMIAPSHGPIYRSHISEIIALYRKWSAPDPDKRKVVLVYGSMYGRAKKLADTIAQRLEKNGMSVVVFDASTTHPSYILAELVDAYILFLVHPTYDGDVFPPIQNLLYIIQMKEMGRGRAAAVVNTHMWTPTARRVVEMLRKAGFALIEPVVETKALPDRDALAKIDELISSTVKYSSL